MSSGDASPRTTWTANPEARSREVALRQLASDWLPVDAVRDAAREVAAWPGYRPSSPVPLPALATAHGLGELHVQHEGGRFGLESFKGWGGGYGARRLLERHPGATLACATDGNHGRAVAWAAVEFGGRAVVYMADVASERAEARIRELGADVVRVDGDHEVASTACLRDARENGWYVVTETENATEPRTALDTMAGYGALWVEALAPFGGDPPTHLFVQAGVGGLAAVAAAYTARRFGRRRPVLVVVEAEGADCIGRGLAAGRRVAIEGPFATRLAGLAAGATSTCAWALLRAGADLAMTIADEAAYEAVRRLAGPRGDDGPLIVGSSGAAGLAGLLVACREPGLRKAARLGREARVLVIATESATDPAAWERIVGRPPPGA